MTTTSVSNAVPGTSGLQPANSASTESSGASLVPLNKTAAANSKNGQRLMVSKLVDMISPKVVLGLGLTIAAGAVYVLTQGLRNINPIEIPDLIVNGSSTDGSLIERVTIPTGANHFPVEIPLTPDDIIFPENLFNGTETPFANATETFPELDIPLDDFFNKNSMNDFSLDTTPEANFSSLLDQTTNFTDPNPILNHSSPEESNETPLPNDIDKNEIDKTDKRENNDSDIPNLPLIDHLVTASIITIGSVFSLALLILCRQGINRLPKPSSFNFRGSASSPSPSSKSSKSLNIKNDSRSDYDDSINNELYDSGDSDDEKKPPSSLSSGSSSASSAANASNPSDSSSSGSSSTGSAADASNSSDSPSASSPSNSSSSASVPGGLPSSSDSPINQISHSNKNQDSGNEDDKEMIQQACEREIQKAMTLHGSREADQLKNSMGRLRTLWIVSSESDRNRLEPQLMSLAISRLTAQGQNVKERELKMNIKDTLNCAAKEEGAREKALHEIKSWSQEDADRKIDSDDKTSSAPLDTKPPIETKSPEIVAKPPRIVRRPPGRPPGHPQGPPPVSTSTAVVPVKP